VELLKQPAASPFPPEKEVVSIWAGTTGKLDDLDVDDVRSFEAELHDYIAHNKPEIFKTILETAKLEDDTIALLEAAVTEVKAQFTSKAPTRYEIPAEAAPRKVKSVEEAIAADAKS